MTAKKPVSMIYRIRNRARGYEERMTSLRDEPRECGQDPELVFDADTQGDEDREDALVAMRPICRRCPVYGECLTEGLRVEVVGVWGGRSTRERKELRRRFRIAPEPVGPNHRTETTPPELAAVAAVHVLVEQRVEEWLAFRRSMLAAASA